MVVSDIFGVSGRAMLESLIAGRRDPQDLAELARGRMRIKRPVLIEALTGSFTDHHAFLLSAMLGRIDGLDRDIATVEAAIAERLAPFAGLVGALDEIPGISTSTAAVIIAEIGVDMTRFPTAAHLAGRARFAPGVHESAGRRTGSSATGHGTRYNDLGQGFFEARRGTDHARRVHVRQLEALGYKVTLQLAA